LPIGSSIVCPQSDFLGAADLIAGGRAGVLAVADAAVLLPLLASAFDAASQHQVKYRIKLGVRRGKEESYSRFWKCAQEDH
jgi:hypothetical protein